MAKGKIGSVLSHADPERFKLLGPTTDLSIYKDVVIPQDVEDAKTKLYQQYLEPYRLQIAPYAMKWIYKAALATTPEERREHLEKARQKFEQIYLGAWSRGDISPIESNAPPMPEEVKHQLKQLNKERREEAKQEREQKLARQKQLDIADGKKETPKRSKIPVFQDPDAQKLVLQKYPWVIEGSFKQDPEKPGGTNLDIVCQVGADGCTKVRTIHLADAFQCKTCVNCKSKR